MLTTGILVNSGIVALKFIPKDFLEVLGYNLDVNSFMIYGVLAFTIAGALGSLSIINFNDTKITWSLRGLSIVSCAMGAVFTIIAVINWSLASNFYILIFSLALVFMDLSLMLLEIYSILEGIRGNWRG